MNGEATLKCIRSEWVSRLGLRKTVACGPPISIPSFYILRVNFLTVLLPQLERHTSDQHELEGVANVVVEDAPHRVIMSGRGVSVSVPQKRGTTPATHCVRRVARTPRTLLRSAGASLAHGAHYCF